MCISPNLIKVVTDKTTGLIDTSFVGPAKNVLNETFEDAFVKIEYQEVSCHNCIECLIQYSDEWAVRCCLEASFHRENCMITLTYADNPVSLCPSDGDKFVQDLRNYCRRRENGLRIRYFYCGEYGSRGQRPHFHFLVFGWRPKDLQFYFSRKGNHPVYLSDTVAKIWNKGFISVEDINYNSAKYCAKYLQKIGKIPLGAKPSYVRMSNRPGIGYSPNMDFYSLLSTDKVYILGKTYAVPSYVLSRIERDNSIDCSHLRSARFLRSQISKQNISHRERRYDIFRGYLQ